MLVLRNVQFGAAPLGDSAPTVPSQCAPQTVKKVAENGDFMVISLWFYGDVMVILWWFDGDLMVIWWWFDGDLMVI